MSTCTEARCCLPAQARSLLEFVEAQAEKDNVEDALQHGGLRFSLPLP